MDPYCGDNVMEKDPIFRSYIYPRPMHDEQFASAEVSSTKRKEISAAGVRFGDENGVGRLTGRDRRSKMNEMYSELQSVVPNLPFKPSKDDILTETIKYVKKLEKEKVRLEEMKESMEASAAVRKTLSEGTAPEPSVSVAASGGMVLFEIKAMARKGLALDIFKVFERHKAEALAANVTVYEEKLVMSVTALVVKTSDEDVISAAERIKAEIKRL